MGKFADVAQHRKKLSSLNFVVGRVNLAAEVSSTYLGHLVRDPLLRDSLFECFSKDHQMGWSVDLDKMFGVVLPCQGDRLFAHTQRNFVCLICVGSSSRLIDSLYGPSDRLLDVQHQQANAAI